MELAQYINKNANVLENVINKQITNPGKFLVDKGLLFIINREVLHPLGLSLAVHLDANNNTVSMSLWDFREDPAGIVFEKESFEEGLAKYAKFSCEEGIKFMRTREELLGFIVQEA